MGFLWTRNLIFGSAESFIWNTYIRFFLIGFPNLLRFWFFRFLFFLDSLSDSHRDFLFPLMGSYFLSLLVDSLVFRKFRDFRFRFFWEFSLRLPWWTEPTIILESDWLNWKTVFQLRFSFSDFFTKLNKCVLGLFQIYLVEKFINWYFITYGLWVKGCGLFGKLWSVSFVMGIMEGIVIGSGGNWGILFSVSRSPFGGFGWFQFRWLIILIQFWKWSLITKTDFVMVCQAIDYGVS